MLYSLIFNNSLNSLTDLNPPIENWYFAEYTTIFAGDERYGVAASKSRPGSTGTASSRSFQEYV